MIQNTSNIRRTANNSEWDSTETHNNRWGDPNNKRAKRIATPHPTPSK